MYFFPWFRILRHPVDYSKSLVSFLLLEIPMFTDFERFSRFIIALALIVLALDLFYWRP
jgi:hypothetical protein